MNNKNYVDLAKKDISLLLRFSSGALFILEHFFLNNSTIEKLRKKNLALLIRSLQKTRQREGLAQGLVFSVDRVKDLSRDEFISKYIKNQIPVIFEGAANNWPCSQKWSVDYLLQKYSDEKFHIVSRVGLIEKNEEHEDLGLKEFSETLTIKDFVQNLKSTGEKYMRFSPIMESKQELIDDLDQHWLKKMRQCFWGISYQTFIGAKNKMTPLHGGESTSFFSIVAEGEKTWDLIPTSYYPFIRPNADGFGYNFSHVNIEEPDLNLYPGFNLIHRYRCTLKKGDVLYVPAWMWHQVKNEAESWTVSYRFTNIRGILSQYAFVVIRTFFTKPSVIKTLYYSVFKANLSKRQDSLLTPRLFR